MLLLRRGSQPTVVCGKILRKYINYGLLMSLVFLSFALTNQLVIEPEQYGN